MSEKKWTPEQEQSIYARGGSLLISAAAGSGKTAVLVERIIDIVTAENPPVDIDRLLVVTYTRAAAAEMRQRLSTALSKRMAKEPDNQRYQRQQMLLPRASISTVHGFCARILQEYAAQAEVPMGFRVAEETQTKLLAAQALDEVLEENYRRRDPAFMALAAQLNVGRSDSVLRYAVQGAYTFMQAQPFPERWLQEQIDAYSAVIPLEKTEWMKPILKYMDMQLEYADAQACRAYETALAAGIEPYAETLLIDRRQIAGLRQIIAEGTYDEMQQAVTGHTFEKFSPVSNKDPMIAEAKKEVSALRDEEKKAIARCVGLFCGTEAQCRADLAQMAPLADALGLLVREYTQRFSALKRQEKLLDYNDLEHKTLRLLVDPATGERTPLAEELSHRFAYIMVDEYQDTNAAQDALFTALSQDEKNLFFVGDVKQSIYGFRQAMPFLFVDRRDAYAPYNEKSPVYPATITLKNNFRSRHEVTDTVNFLFRQIMDGRIGDVAYSEQEELKYSAEYPPSAHAATQWLLLDKQAAAEEDITADQAEARQIGQRIREMMAEMTVREGDGTRPLRYDDICVLFRTRTYMGEYVKELTGMGIPVAVDKGESFLSTPEVRAALSLLRVIDNPLREVELTAVMMSPLFGFTADDLAALRLVYGRYKPLYVAVEKMATEGEDPDLSARCALLLACLRRLRTLAVSLPADRLLETAYRETDMEAVFSARSGGSQRVANLHQLDRMARSFEQGGFRGLSAFVRYMDRLEEQGIDMEGGNTLHRDGVRLMTVHASKGLEFPVVFLARLGGQKNNRDATGKLLFHHRVGIGMKLTDDDEGEKHVPLPYQAVLCARALDEAAEDLRVWYVALTRAKEKLVMLYSVKDPWRAIEKAHRHVPKTGALLPAVVMQAVSPGEMLLTAALRHPDFVPYRRGADIHTLDAKTPWEVTVCEEVAPLHVTVADETVEEDACLIDLLKQRIDFAYPYIPLQRVPAQLAASQLSHQEMHRQHVATTPPAFLQKEGMTAAEKGTAMHTFMQYADYAAAAIDPMAEAQRLLSAGFLTPQQTEVLSEEKLRRFFESDLYRRMTASDKVWREYHYILDLPAGELAKLPENMAAETVVVQGIADCVFREGDHLILVDYKTDKIKTAEELVRRYHSQMQFYKKALETILGLPVTEMLLYSFALGKTVEVE